MAADRARRAGARQASGWRRWPPRLPEQPIFYPVLNEEYATMIARDWNVKQSTERATSPSSRFGRTSSTARGSSGRRADTILEYWIPAEDLDALNENIIGTIDVVAEYR